MNPRKNSDVAFCSWPAKPKTMHNTTQTKIARDTTGAMNKGTERRGIASNENKMSCAGRGRASLRVEGF
jgi:hypothetical protein